MLVARPKKPIRIKIGKGVLAKDGKTPFAAGSILATSRFGMSSSHVFSHATVAHLLADDAIVEIQVIDLDNVKSTIRKNWVAMASEEERAARRSEIFGIAA